VSSTLCGRWRAGPLQCSSGSAYRSGRGPALCQAEDLRRDPRCLRKLDRTFTLVARYPSSAFRGRPDAAGVVDDLLRDHDFRRCAPGGRQRFSSWRVSPSGSSTSVARWRRAQECSPRPACVVLRQPWCSNAVANRSTAPVLQGLRSVLMPHVRDLAVDHGWVLLPSSLSRVSVIGLAGVCRRRRRRTTAACWDRVMAGLASTDLVATPRNRFARLEAG
jgi:hypothetical protein